MSEQSSEFLLKINPLDVQIYAKRHIYMTRPRILKVYEIDHDGNISLAKKFPYFRKPETTDYPLDLNVPLENFNFVRPPYKTIVLLTLHHEMTASLDNTIFGHCGDSDADLELTKVYTRRGTLRYIMEFCYAYKFDTAIRVIRHSGNLYIFQSEEELLDHHKTKVFTNHSRLRRQLFVEKPNGLPDLETTFYDFEKQNCLYHSNLGKFNIFYTGEVDGIVMEKEFHNMQDIKVINKLSFAMGKQMWYHLKHNQNKLLNYWTQGYLANIENLYIAYKDTFGVVQEPIEHMKVSQIPKSCRWKPNVCTSFLNDFLERVEKLMWKVDSFDTVYVFKFCAKEKTIHYEIHERNSMSVFIPEEYIEFVNNQIV